MCSVFFSGVSFGQLSSVTSLEIPKRQKAGASIPASTSHLGRGGMLWHAPTCLWYLSLFVLCLVCSVLSAGLTQSGPRLSQSADSALFLLSLSVSALASRHSTGRAARRQAAPGTGHAWAWLDTQPLALSVCSWLFQSELDRSDPYLPSSPSLSPSPIKAQTLGHGLQPRSAQLPCSFWTGIPLQFS